MTWYGIATLDGFKGVVQINRLSPNRYQRQFSDQRLDSVGEGGEY